MLALGISTAPQPRPRSNRHWRRWALLLAAVVITVGAGAFGVDAWIKLSALAAETRVAQGELIEGARTLNVAGPTLTASQAKAALSHFDAARDHFGHVHRVLGQSRTLGIMGHLPWVGRQLAAARDLSDMGEHLSHLGALGVKVAASVFAGAPTSPKGSPEQGEKILAALQTFDANVSSITSEVRQVTADRAMIPNSGLVSDLSRAVQRFDSKVNLNAIEQSLAELRADEGGIRALLGASGPETYVVIDQDPAELRATGGFIGTVGFLTFDHGRMSPFVPHDVYEIDDKSRARSVVIPPAPFQATFHLKTWMLRDSNWSPDFPTAARQAETFLNSEAGRHVDGVIAIDPFFVQKVLSFIGPVQIPETGDVVTEKNFFEVTLMRVERSGGSTRETKQFVAQAAKAVVARVTSLQPHQWFSLVQTLQQGCDRRSLQAYFHADSAAAMVSRHNCDGRLRSPAGDGVMIVDSNVGGNKDDFWLKRHFGMTLQVQPDGTVTHVLHLHYDGISPHDGITGSWGYTDWLRIYLPPGVSVRSVSGAKLQSGTELGHNLLQGWLYVQFEHSTDVTVVYDVPTQGKVSGTLRLSLLWQKQAGREADPISVDVSGPQGWKLTSGQMGSSKLNTANVTADLSVDREFVFRYQPN